MRLKERSMKSLTLLLAVLLVTTLIIGCGKKQEDSSGTTTQSLPSQQVKTEASSPKDPYDPSEMVELTLWSAPSGVYTTGQQPGDYIAQDLVPEWNKQFPNVKVNVQLLPWDGIAEKITVAVQSKTLPDIYFDSGLRILSYANMGAVESLNDVIPAEDLAKFSKPEILQYCSINNKDIVCLPYISGGSLLMVNKTIWENANAADLLPQDEFRTWTLDEFKAALRAVADKEKGIYGLSLFALNEQGDSLYANTIDSYTGKNKFSDDFKRYIAAENPDTETVLAFFKSLVDEGLVTPHPETLSSTNAWEYFKQGKNGIVNAGASHPDIIKTGIKDGSIKEPFQYTYVNYPGKTKGKASLSISLGQNCAFKTDDPLRTKWAKKFLVWSVTETDIMYVVIKAADLSGKTQLSWVDQDPELALFTKILGKAGEWPIMQPTWSVKGYSEMRAAMFPEMQSMFINRTTPKETVENIADKFNEILAKTNK